MLALVGTVILRPASRKVLLRDGHGILGTHRCVVRTDAGAMRNCASVRPARRQAGHVAARAAQRAASSRSFTAYLRASAARVRR